VSRSARDPTKTHPAVTVVFAAVFAAMFAAWWFLSDYIYPNGELAAETFGSSGSEWPTAT
jgi:hypothetical protein